MVSRGWKVAALALLTAGLALALLVPRAVRGRVRRIVGQRCERQLDATCAVGDVGIAIDGVLLRDLRVRARSGRVAANVARVGVRLGWLKYVFGVPQRVAVDIDGVTVRVTGSLPDLLRDLRARRREETPSSTSRKFRLRAVHLAGLEVSARVLDVGGHPITASLRGGGLEWTRDGATTARWDDAQTEYPGVRGHTGTCTVLSGIDRTSSLDCSEFDATVDVAQARQYQAAAESVLAALDARSPQPDGAADTAAPPEVPARDAQARFREGRVRLTHGDDLIADLTPASISALVERGSLREASFQLGGADARQPSLSLSFNRMREPWQVDLDVAALPLRELAPWVPSVPWHDTSRGRAHARVHIEPGEQPERLDVSGDLFVENFGLEHRRLAHEAIDGLSVSLDGSAVIDLARRRVTTPGLHWQVNGIPFTVAGWVERGASHTAMDVGLQMPPVSCEGALRSLPRTVTGVTVNLSLHGAVGGNARIALDTRHLSDTVFSYNVQDGCEAAGSGWELSVRRFEGPFVQRVMEPNGTMRAFVTGPGSPAWVPIEALPPNLLNAVITREDGGFYRHEGFSPNEIRGALVRNVSEGRFAYGASTLSMQLAKNVFLAREKTLVRKLQEVLLTWWIERELTKEKILELYLNVVEFGPGIYGIGPASRFFFAREPRDLTPLQAIYLATLLPAPVPRFAIFQRGAASPDTVARLRAIARAMGVTRAMSAADVAAAQSEAFAFRPRTDPVPGAATLEVDPTTTDDAARALAERAMTQVREAPPVEGDAREEAPGERDAGAGAGGDAGEIRP